MCAQWCATRHSAPCMQQSSRSKYLGRGSRARPHAPSWNVLGVVILMLSLLYRLVVCMKPLTLFLSMGKSSTYSRKITNTSILHIRNKIMKEPSLLALMRGDYQN
jgi:hypothetical protein